MIMKNVAQNNKAANVILIVSCFILLELRSLF